VEDAKNKISQKVQKINEDSKEKENFSVYLDLKNTERMIKFFNDHLTTLKDLKKNTILL